MRPAPFCIALALFVAGALEAQRSTAPSPVYDPQIAMPRASAEQAGRTLQYFYVPVYGTIVVSPVHLFRSRERKGMLFGQTLTMTTADGDPVQLASGTAVPGEQSRSIRLSVDHGHSRRSGHTLIGYGFADEALYGWPERVSRAAQARRPMPERSALPIGTDAYKMALPCQTIAEGQAIRQVRVNGLPVAPAACGIGGPAGMPVAYGSGERSGDDSGGLSASIVDDHMR